MKCKDCKHYKPTQLKVIDIEPYIGKGYTLDKILELSKDDEVKPLYDCLYATDWCEADYEINTLCDNRFEPKLI